MQPFPQEGTTFLCPTQMQEFVTILGDLTKEEPLILNPGECKDLRKHITFHKELAKGTTRSWEDYSRNDWIESTTFAGISFRETKSSDGCLCDAVRIYSVK